MKLTERQTQIVSRIDLDIQIIGQQAKTREAAEEAIIKLMPECSGPMRMRDNV